MYQTGLRWGIVFAGLGIILGAFGAHALKPLLEPDQLQVFETGVRYQMYHAFALLAAGILYRFAQHKAVRIACWCFLTGILLFSGSLYAMTFLKIRGQVGLGGLGLVTPLGGLFFIAGWILLLAGTIKRTDL